MILQTGMRTDIPAFYAEWFANRVKDGYVLVRNPYNPVQVTRYRLDPAVVDLIGFCSKNPAPMLKYMDLLKPFGMYWFVTITPYGTDIEPRVPDREKVMDTFLTLSDIVGADSMGWRYDPILLNEKYTMEYHLKSFEHDDKIHTQDHNICIHLEKASSFNQLYQPNTCEKKAYYDRYQPHPIGNRINCHVYPCKMVKPAIECCKSNTCSILTKRLYIHRLNQNCPYCKHCKEYASNQ